MRGSIRKAEFTWDPQHESKRHIWLRIMRYVRSELDRINEESKRHTQVRRRVESPFYQRDREMLRACEEDGVSVADLARQHGMSKTRVRELLRFQRYYRRNERLTVELPTPPVKLPPHRTLPDLPRTIPQTRALPTDP